MQNTLTSPVRESTIQMSNATFASLRDYIYQKTGIYFQDTKKYLLEGRLGRRLKALNLRTFEEYQTYLLSSGVLRGELQELYNIITINETYFFRNDAQFEVLENALVPRLLSSQSGATKKLRIWSSASSSGEEAYTLSMIYHEKLRYRHPGLKMEIVGTDINDEVVKQARSGVYRQFSVRSMPQNYIQKYLRVNGNTYTVSDELRSCVHFENLNLYDRPAMKTMRNFDVIFCCNVLIYFDQKSKIQIVSDLYDALNPGGYLFIGYSESLHGISSAFRLENHAKTVVYAKERL